MKISNGVNKKISFPIAIIIIVACAILIGLVIWRCKFILPEIYFEGIHPSKIEKGGGENKTKDFLRDDSNLNNIRIKLSDIHGLWGGRDISISGSGETFIEIIGLKPPEIGLYIKEYRLLLLEPEIKNLIDLFIKNDFLTIQEPIRKEVLPDETRPTIILENSKKEKHAVSMWHTDIEKNEKFAEIYQNLLTIEEKTQGLTSFFEGKFSFSCDELEREIKSWLEEVNYCENDSECVSENRYYCPFGCHQFFNKNTSLSLLDEKVKIFRDNNCHPCEYECEAPPEDLEWIKCLNNKCVDLRE